MPRLSDSLTHLEGLVVHVILPALPIVEDDQMVSFPRMWSVHENSMCASAQGHHDDFMREQMVNNNLDERV